MMTPQETGEVIWMGKRVKQVGGDFAGRIGTVTEVFIDEKNVFHCFCNNDAGGFWCPIHFLRKELC